MVLNFSSDFKVVRQSNWHYTHFLLLIFFFVYTLTLIAKEIKSETISQDQKYVQKMSEKRSGDELPPFLATTVA